MIPNIRSIKITKTSAAGFKRLTVSFLAISLGYLALPQGALGDTFTWNSTLSSGSWLTGKSFLDAGAAANYVAGSPVVFNSSPTANFAVGDKFSIGDMTISSGNTLTLGATGTTPTPQITEVGAGTGNLILDVVGAGASQFFALNGTAAWNGTLNSEVGTIRIFDGPTANSGANTQIVDSGGKFTFTGSSNTVGSLSGTSGSVSLFTSTGTSVVAGTNVINDVQSANTSFGGVFSDAGVYLVGLTMSGTGNLILTGANTNTGATTVSSGKLLVNGTGSLAATATTVATGAAFGGSGLSAGATTVNGTLVTGDGVTTGTTFTLANALTMNAGSTLQFTLGAGNTNSSLALSNGADVFSPSMLVDFLNIQAGTYNNLITGLTLDPGTESTWGLTADDAGYNVTYTFAGGDLSAIITAAPEPSVWVMMMGGLVLLMAIQYRRRSLV